MGKPPKMKPTIQSIQKRGLNRTWLTRTREAPPQFFFFFLEKKVLLLQTCMLKFQHCLSLGYMPLSFIFEILFTRHQININL